MTEEELNALVRRNPQISVVDHNPRTQVLTSEPEHYPAPALADVATGKAGSLQRITVRFIGYRVRPLDPDNFAGSTKDLLDGLRRAGLIPDDTIQAIKLETDQVRVAHRSEERLTIQLIYPPNPTTENNNQKELCLRS